MFRTSYLLWFLGSIDRARFSHTVIFSFNIVKYIYKPPRVNEKSKINPWFILLARRGVPCSCGKFSNFKVTSKWNFGFPTKLRINDLWCKPRTFWEKKVVKNKIKDFLWFNWCYDKIAHFTKTWKLMSILAVNESF